MFSISLLLSSAMASSESLPPTKARSSRASHASADVAAAASSATKGRAAEPLLSGTSVSVVIVEELSVVVWGVVLLVWVVELLSVVVCGDEVLLSVNVVRVRVSVSPVMLVPEVPVVVCGVVEIVVSEAEVIELVVCEVLVSEVLVSDVVVRGATRIAMQRPLTGLIPSLPAVVEV